MFSGLVYKLCWARLEWHLVCSYLFLTTGPRPFWALWIMRFSILTGGDLRLSLTLCELRGHFPLVLLGGSFLASQEFPHKQLGESACSPRLPCVCTMAWKPSLRTQPGRYMAPFICFPLLRDLCLSLHAIAYVFASVFSWLRQAVNPVPATKSWLKAIVNHTDNLSYLIVSPTPALRQMYYESHVAV